jgi:hypothetical protein
MSERLRSLPVAHGALIFLAGMAVGFFFAFQILDRAEIWPLPGSLDIQILGGLPRLAESPSRGNPEGPAADRRRRSLHRDVTRLSWDAGAPSRVAFAEDETATA